MKKLKKKIEITVEKTNTGYSAYSEVHGVYSTAVNTSSLYTNLVDALNLYYEDLGYEVSVDN